MEPAYGRHNILMIDPPGTGGAGLEMYVHSNEFTETDTLTAEYSSCGILIRK
jgi:hypothetical protein